jgi:hypothetical protein
MKKEVVTVANSDGTPAAGATVQVRDTYSGANLTLYEDNETTTKTNPITVPSSGLASFKIPNSVVDLIITNGADTKTITALKVSDGAELALFENGQGSALAYGEVCFIDTDGTAKKATNAGTEQQARARWICVTRGGLADNAVGVFSGPGMVSGLSGGVAGSSAYLDTAGAIMETALDPTDDANIGKYRVYLGEWQSSTALNFNPSEPIGI